ncbi:hypothetical protein BCR42DRAFT_418217, partial [Absidia repens]
MTLSRHISKFPKNHWRMYRLLNNDPPTFICITVTPHNYDINEKTKSYRHCGEYRYS